MMWSEAHKYNLYVESPYNVSISPPCEGLFLPVYSSHDINEDNDNNIIERAVIAIHGYTRNAVEFFVDIMGAVSRSDTIIVVPYFPDHVIDGNCWGSNPRNNTRSLHWKTSNWMKGANNSPHPKQFTSSFDVMDTIVSILTSMQRFKSMKLVCLAGFSAGAQYLNRYAWASDVGFNSQQKTSTPVVRFILSDAASYLYFSSVRPDPLCRPMNSTVTTSSNCRSFSIPKNGIEIEMELEWEHMPCPEYDSWKHGTTGIPSLGYNYLSKFSEKNSDAEMSKFNKTLALSTKDIRFIFGERDVCNCNSNGYLNLQQSCFQEPLLNSSNSTICCHPHDEIFASDMCCCDSFPDSMTNFVSPRCEDMLQGSNRLQRGLLYTSYLENVVWQFLQYTAVVAIVPTMTHNRSAFFKSNAFQEWIFDVNNQNLLDIEDENDDGEFPLYVLTFLKALIVILVCFPVIFLIAGRMIPSEWQAVRRISDDDAVWLADLSMREGSADCGAMLDDADNCDDNKMGVNEILSATESFNFISKNARSISRKKAFIS